jgi:hypothetical protein
MGFGLMSNEMWRWADPGGQQRTVRIDELRAALAGGVIAPNTPVWKPGWTAWRAAHEVPELTTSALSAANGVVPNIPPPPLAMVAVQAEFERKAGDSFSPPPLVAASPVEEPPPPPKYVPLPVKAASMPAPPPAPPPPQSSGALPPSLPTTLGLPPPPEIAAMAAAAKAKSAGTANGLGPPPPTSDAILPPTAVGPSKPPPPLPGRSKAPPPPGESIEELSSSMLMTESSSSMVAAQPALGSDASFTSDGSLPSTEPVMPPSDAPGDDEPIAGLPSSNPLQGIIHDLRELKAGRRPKNRLLVPVLGGLGAVLVLLLVVIVVSAFGGDDKTKADKASAEGLAPAEGLAAGTPAPGRADEIVPPPASAKSAGATTASVVDLGDCRSAGESHVVAPRAMVGAGVEAAVVPDGIALGFASSPRDAVAVSFDPRSVASATSTAKAHVSGGDARRVAPAVSEGKLAVMADVDRRGDKLVGRRTVATEPPVDIGVAGGVLAWAPHGEDSWAKLFDLSGEGPIEALRGVPLAQARGIAITFRRGAAVYVGTATGDAVLKGEGSLHRVAGLGEQVGAPAIAASGDSVILAFADRASGEDPWQVRLTRLGVGTPPADPRSFAVPAGGLGEHAMSPAVGGLGAGRFLLAWAEGPVSGHQIRAATVNADDSLSGAAFGVSGEGVKAGQPQVAVGPDGRGLVAYFAVQGKNIELQAAPITCAK